MNSLFYFKTNTSCLLAFNTFLKKPSAEAGQFHLPILFLPSNLMYLTLPDLSNFNFSVAGMPGSWAYPHVIKIKKAINRISCFFHELLFNSFI